MAKAAKRAPAKTRQLDTPKYSSFRLSKRIKHQQTGLPSVYRLTRSSFGLLRSRWKLFSGMVLVYALLTIVIVGGLGLGSDIGSLKEEVQATWGNDSVSTSLGVFYYLLVSGNAPASEAGGVYQFFLIIIFSLASIWALRQVLAGKPVSIKQSFYSGMYPLVPFLLVMLVVVLQLVPLLVGNYFYSLAVGGGIAVELAEKLLWGVLAGLLALLSLYMVSSSIIALYISTLPDMKPMQALRSAREIVLHRRFLVMRKVLALPLILLLLLAVIVVPLIIFAAPVAQVVFFILSMALLLIAHSYLYGLYRELL